jgi:hypothetical protein
MRRGLADSRSDVLLIVDDTLPDRPRPTPEPQVLSLAAAGTTGGIGLLERSSISRPEFNRRAFCRHENQCATHGSLTRRVARDRLDDVPRQAPARLQVAPDRFASDQNSRSEGVLHSFHTPADDTIF